MSGAVRAVAFYLGTTLFLSSLLSSFVQCEQCRRNPHSQRKLLESIIDSFDFARPYLVINISVAAAVVAGRLFSVATAAAWTSRLASLGGIEMALSLHGRDRLATSLCKRHSRVFNKVTVTSDAQSPFEK